MMSKERMVQVTKEEYENLIRDRHTVEVLKETETGLLVVNRGSGKARTVKK